MNTPQATSEARSYWASRSHFNYYKTVRMLLEHLGPLESILDIGCADTPVATWGQFDRRYTVDVMERPPLDRVQAVVGTWPEVPQEPKKWSVICCLQVLEHLPEARLRQAVNGIMHRSQVFIVSVPYNWRPHACPYHLHDPITLDKFLSWMRGLKPSWIDCVKDEHLNRLVALFDTRREKL